MPRIIIAVLALTVLVPTGAGSQGAGAAAIEKAFEAYWKAGSPRDAERAAERLVKAGVDFETAWSRLKTGRRYRKEKLGALSWRSPGPGGVFDNLIEIPETYDPSKPWPVRVQLHGGVMRAGETVGGGPDIDGGDETGGAAGAGRAPNLSRRRGPNRIPGEPQIYVQPGAWREAAWWHEPQVENILRLLDRLKRTYNVDESKIYLTGISDGGTGVYYLAVREPTLWSSVLPLNGSIIVLGNPAIQVDGEIFAGNLANKPLYIVSGGKDPLYPVEHVQTHVAWFKTLGVSVLFSPQPFAGHDTSWWRYERIPYEKFVREHPRDPHPARVSWETERVDRFNRVHWLIIDGLRAPGPGDTPFEPAGHFTQKKPSGRVDVVREGNAFIARSRGVASFTLLLSPDVVDFEAPVTVTVNGRPAFEGPVRQDASTLITWAARDNDRTMLYGAALSVRVP
jgi:predicted esterase